MRPKQSTKDILKILKALKTTLWSINKAREFEIKHSHTHTYINTRINGNVIIHLTHTLNMFIITNINVIMILKLRSSSSKQYGDVLFVSFTCL